MAFDLGAPERAPLPQPSIEAMPSFEEVDQVEDVSADESSFAADERALAEAQASPQSTEPEIVPFLETAVQNNDPFLIDVQKILEMDLTSVIKTKPIANEDVSLGKAMSDEAKARFVHEGQLLAQKIANKRDRLQAEEVVKWVKQWLVIIPQVNKWFLFQEAKIKTDLIIGLTKSTSALS